MHSINADKANGHNALKYICVFIGNKHQKQKNRGEEMRLSCIWTRERTKQTNYITTLTFKPQREHLLVWGCEPVTYSNPVFILNLSPLNLIKWLVVSATSSPCSPQRRRFPFGRAGWEAASPSFVMKSPLCFRTSWPRFMHCSPPPPPDRPLSAHHLFSHPWRIVRLYPDELPVFTVVRHFVWGQWRLHGGVLR